MVELEALAGQARALAEGRVPLASPQDEVARVLQICNACRYCEGFCAVFPAMTRRLAFPAADAHYLANLCHNCGACLHACQYAPPHAFAVNVPQAMARTRLTTYKAYAWPRAFGAAYERNGLVLALALVLGLTVFLALGVALNGSLVQAPAGGNFYAVFPHGLMVGVFAPVFLFAVLALGIGAHRFWRLEKPGPVSAPALAEGLGHAARLTYLDGGHGEGCNEEGDRFTLARRRWHHFTFYGFLLCFASTSVATVYHYGLGWQAPYGFASLPKLLGVTGGVGLVIGVAGLWHLNRRRHPQQGDVAQRPMDRAFMALLFLTAASGLVLAFLRTTAAMPLLLCLHLGAVLALFATLPYGKFAHGVFRATALLKWSVEKRQPSRLQLGDD
jgi:citrate/tricarballylate utilization protein